MREKRKVERRRPSRTGRNFRRLSTPSRVGTRAKSTAIISDTPADTQTSTAVPVPPANRAAGTTGRQRVLRPVGNAMGHVARRDVTGGRFHVTLLIVEKDIGTEGPEKRSLVPAAEEQGLVDTDTPVPQG